MEEPRHYQVGRDFMVTLQVPNLQPTAYLVAEFSGPINAHAERTVLTTHPGPSMAKGGGGNYTLRGPIPEGTPLGTYTLTRVTLHWTIGGKKSQDFPERDLPQCQIIVDPHSPDEPPLLPKITRAR
jgi:hypothetical protein